MAMTSAMSTQITQLYVVMFGRAPEAGGLAYWVNLMGEGASFASIAQQMYNAEAARSAYPIYLTNEGIVTKFYTNVLGRSPDVAGMYYWTDKLGASDATVGSVVAELCNAIVNYRADDAVSAASQALFNNKVAVGLYFGETLQGTSVTDATAVLKLVTATSMTAAKAAASYSADPVYRAATDAATAAKVAADAAAAKAAADAAAAKAAAIVALEVANEATAASALTAYNAAKVISDASAVAALSAGTAADAAATAVTSFDLANASITAAALAASTAATSVTKAGLTSAAAASLAAAAAATTVTTDDAGATAATAAAAIAAAAAAAIVTAASTKVAAATSVAATYAPQTFTLLTGADNFTGGLGIDIFNASSTATFNVGDSINGGAGNDTLNVSDNAAEVATTGRSVINVETANLSSSEKVTANTTGWTGLTRLNVLADVGDTSVTAATTTAVTVAAHSGGNLTVTGGSSQTVTTSDTSNKTVTLSGANGVVSLTGTLAGTGITGGAINVIGGSTITVNETQTQATVNRTTTAGVVTVTGDTSTTSVSVTNSRAVTASGTAAGIANNAVFIEDANWFRPAVADTITSVTISAYSVSQIYSKSVTSLSLANSAGDAVITDFGAIYNRTLALTVDGLTAGTIGDTGRYATLNVTTANNASTLSGIDFSALQTLTVAGTKLLTLNSTASLTALKTLTVTGSAGISVNVSSNSAVTAVDTTATTGTTTITLNATASTFSGGAGVDNVTAAGLVSKAISLGAGNDTFVHVRGTPTANINGGDGIDTLSISAVLAASNSSDATFADKVTGFELLTLTGSTNQTVDVAVLGNYSAVSTSGGNGLTLNNLPSGGTLTLTGAGTAYTVSNAAFREGRNDILNLVLTDGSGNAINFATTGITATGVETVAITTADTQTVPTNPLDRLTLLGDSYPTITVAGNAGLNLTASTRALTSLDARGITANHLEFTSGALVYAADIKGSASGGDVINAAAATNAVTIIETAGANAITGSSTFASTLTGGTGADTIVGGAGKDTIVGGGGADSITGGARADSILLSGTTAKIVNAALGDSGINTATSLQTAELTSLFDVVFGAVAGIKIQLFTSTPAVNLSASNLAGSDDVVNFARGVYDFASGVFTFRAAGPDTAMTYDTTVGAGTAFETIILVGYTAAMATAISGGLITLA